MWRYFSIFITLMASSFAQASDWIVLSPPTSEKRSILQLDKESIQREGALVKAWTRAVYYKPVAVPGSEPLTSRVVASLNFVNCKERTLAKQIIVYLSDGDYPVEISKKGPFPAESVIPDTTNELILKTVCQGHQEKPTLPKQDHELPHQVQQSNV